MKVIMYYWPVSSYGKIEDKIQNWANKQYRGEMLYGVTHFKDAGVDVIFPKFKGNRSIARKSWIPNMMDILKDKRKYDIIYSAFPEGLGALIYLRGLRLYRKKIIVWQHTPIEKTKGSNFIKKFLYKIFLRGIDKLIFFDENAQAESLQSGLISKNKAVLLKWGPDLDFFNNILKQVDGQEYKDVRFVATGIYQRDFETLVAAFKGLSQKLDLFVIDKELFEKYKNAAENITVHFAESTEISTYTVGLEVAKSSVVVICSKPLTDKKQPLGLSTLIEASALGKPVIITKNKYLPQYFESEKIGLFVNPLDVEDLKKAIIRISSDSELRLQLKNNSRQVVLEKCNLNMLTKDLVSLFEKS